MRRYNLAFVILFGLLLFAATSGWATTGCWTYNGGTNWNNASPWLSGTIHGGAAGDIAYLTINIGGNRTIGIDMAVTLGRMDIGDFNANANFILTNAVGGSLTFDSVVGTGATLNFVSTSRNNSIGAFSVADAAGLTLNNASITNQTLSGTISGTKVIFNSSNTGTITISGANTYTNGTLLQAGRILIDNNNAMGTGSLTIQSGATAVTAAGFGNMTNQIVNAGSIIVNGNGTLSGPISSNGSIYHPASGAFTMTLTGSNANFSGVITNAGTLKIGNKWALGTSTLYLGDGVNTGGIGLNASFNATGADAVSNNIVLLGDGGVGNNLNTLELAGVISGGFGLNKNGLGRVILSGNNGYTGVTTINAGTLNAGHANALGSVGADITFAGGVLQYSAASASTDWASRFKNSASSIALDTDGQNVTLAGNIENSNKGGLTKLGDGILLLSGSNTYSGMTLVSAGTLSVNGGIYNSAVTATGGTLGGTGFVGNLTIDAGQLSPANSIGTLTVGNLTLTNLPVGALSFELGTTNVPGGSDLVIVTAALNFTGMTTNWFNLSTTNGFGAGTYTLFDAVTGTMSLGTETNFFNIGGSGYDGYLWLDQANSDVQLIVVPEPGTGTMVGAGLMAMLMLRRLRRRQ